MGSYTHTPPSIPQSTVPPLLKTPHNPISPLKPHAPNPTTKTHPQHNIKEVLLFPAMKPDQARQLQNAQIAAAARAASAKKGMAGLSIDEPSA